MPTHNQRAEPEYTEDSSPLLPRVELHEHHVTHNFASETAQNVNAPGLLTIAGGVALGILAASIIGYAYVEWRATQAADAIAAEFRMMSERSRKDAIRAQETQQAKEAAALELEERQAQALAERQREAEDAKRSLENAAMAKEAAWSRFYKKPERCADNPSSSMLIQCANEHIRAKREFESKYEAGRL